MEVVYPLRPRTGYLCSFTNGLFRLVETGYQTDGSLVNGTISVIVVDLNCKDFVIYQVVLRAVKL